MLLLSAGARVILGAGFYFRQSISAEGFVYFAGVGTVVETGAPAGGAGFESSRFKERRALPEGKVEASQPPPRALTRSTAEVMRRSRILTAFCSSLNAMVCTVM